MPQRSPVEQVIATGFRFPEGPCIDRNGSVYVCELAGAAVTRVDASGHTELFAALGGSPNGSAFGPDRALYVANSGGRWAPETSTGGQWGPADSASVVQRVAADGTSSILVEQIDGTPLNAPNDLCFDADGGLWFSDPAWPAEDGAVPPGTICYTDLEGRAVRAHTGLRFPNGLGITADGETLIVAESSTSMLHAFPILGPGRLGQPRRFATLPEGALPDGLCFDARGRVLCAGHGSGRIFVFPPEGGSAEQEIVLGDKDVTNLCFGGPDMTTLYVTESDAGQLVSLTWDTPGMVLFPDR